MAGSTSERWAWWRKGALAAIFASVAVLAGVDLVVDLSAGTTASHVLIEGGTVALTLAAAAGLSAQLLRSIRAQRALELDASNLRASLDQTLRDAKAWREQAGRFTRGLSDAIDRQLSDWELTPAEKEIALLLLKGLSHKEIAQVRAVEESSVRQQSRAIYRKAGLQGRSELAAFFLEDLLAPRPEPARPALEVSR